MPSANKAREEPLTLWCDPTVARGCVCTAGYQGTIGSFLTKPPKINCAYVQHHRESASARVPHRVTIIYSACPARRRGCLLLLSFTAVANQVSLRRLRCSCPCLVSRFLWSQLSPSLHLTSPHPSLNHFTSFPLFLVSLLLFFSSSSPPHFRLCLTSFSFSQSRRPVPPVFLCPYTPSLVDCQCLHPPFKTCHSFGLSLVAVLPGVPGPKDDPLQAA